MLCRRLRETSARNHINHISFPKLAKSIWNLTSIFYVNPLQIPSGIDKVRGSQPVVCGLWFVVKVSYGRAGNKKAVNWIFVVAAVII